MSIREMSRGRDNVMDDYTTTGAGGNNVYGGRHIDQSEEDIP